MISRTPSPSISPTKSSLVITSGRSSRTRTGASATGCCTTLGVSATAGAATGSSAFFGLRPRRLGAATAASAGTGTSGATASAGSFATGTSCVSAGVRPSTLTPDIRGRRPRRLGSSADSASPRGPSPSIAVPIRSSNSFFFNITFSIPKALPISRNSARLLPSSAFTSCIKFTDQKSFSVKIRSDDRLLRNNVVYKRCCCVFESDSIRHTHWRYKYSALLRTPPQKKCNIFLVLGAGIEPARPFLATGF